MSELEVPKGWSKMDNLSEVIETLESGKRPKGGVDGIFEGIPSVGGEHLKYDGKFNFANVKFVPIDFFKNMKQGKIQQNDILIVKDGATTGKTSFVDSEFPYDEACVNEHVFIIRPTSDLLPKFLYYYIRSNFAQKKIFNKTKGDIGGINTNFIDDFPIVFPKDKKIQEKIIQKLDYILDQLDEKKKEILKLENKIAYSLFPNPRSKSGMRSISPLIRKSFEQFLEHAMHGKLTENKENPQFTQNYFSILEKKKPKLATEICNDHNLLSNINKHFLQFHDLNEQLPTGWIWSELDILCTKLTDGTHFSPVNNNKGDFLYLTAKNIQPFYMDLSKITFVSKEDHESIYPRCNPEKGDVLYIKDGSTTGIAIVNELDYEFSMLSSVALLKPEKIVDPYFLMYYLNSPIVFSRVTGRMSGGAITRMTLEKIRKIEVRLPPIDIQQKIIQKIRHFESTVNPLKKKIDELSVEHQNMLDRLENFHKSILDYAFSGKLVK